MSNKKVKLTIIYTPLIILISYFLTEMDLLGKLHK